VRALHTFDKDGDYGVFADLLRRDGVANPVVDCLTRAAFFERTFSVQKAVAALGGVSRILEDDLPGVGRLFTEQLRERLHWRKHPDTYVRQRELALSYLNNGDYPRAAIFAYEAFITSLINKNAGEREHERDDRCRAEQEFLEGQRGNPSQKQNYLLLEKLRNALAHGSKPSDKDVRQIATDENKLRDELQRLIRALLPNIR
ncbi:MAG: TIGR02221 family CRISPR-associated protein, partial [Pseudomonadota bacterium]|nr:TIGR02221 family CRISPR-associated protein [Pseudomonadota bacterium]